MRKHILPLIALGPLAAAAQTPPIRLINAPDASSKPEFAMVAAVRQFAGGRLLVNDINNRQLTILDPGLANAFVLADSASGQLNSYGTRAGGLIRYVGDSTLFVDPAGLSMFVIDPNGKIARVASVPRSQDAGSLGNNLLGTPGVDARGTPRLSERRSSHHAAGRQQRRRRRSGGFAMPDFPDSTAIVRVDLATRKVDTAAYYKIPKTKMNIVQTDKGMTATSELNPMPIVDDWAVLSNGSIAIVRGQDYHVDILKADGTLASATKVPFDWQRLSDEEKVAVIDSAKAALDRARAAGPGDGNAVIAGGARGGGPGAARRHGRHELSDRAGGDGGGVGNKIASMGGGMQPSFVSASELPDYRPAFSQGAARADEDGNVWVRTSATRAGAIGGLIYDVINSQGALADRVQIPGRPDDRRLRQGRRRVHGRPRQDGGVDRADSPVTRARQLDS